MINIGLHTLQLRVLLRTLRYKIGAKLFESENNGKSFWGNN